MKSSKKNNNKKTTALRVHSGTLATITFSICLMKSLNTILKTLVSIYSKKSNKIKRKEKYFIFTFFSGLT